MTSPSCSRTLLSLSDLDDTISLPPISVRATAIPTTEFSTDKSPTLAPLSMRGCHSSSSLSTSFPDTITPPAIEDGVQSSSSAVLPPPRPGAWIPKWKRKQLEEMSRGSTPIDSQPSPLAAKQDGLATTPSNTDMRAEESPLQSSSSLYNSCPIPATSSAADMRTSASSFATTIVSSSPRSSMSFPTFPTSSPASSTSSSPLSTVAAITFATTTNTSVTTSVINPATESATCSTASTSASAASLPRSSNAWVPPSLRRRREAAAQCLSNAAQRSEDATQRLDNSEDRDVVKNTTLPTDNDEVTPAVHVITHTALPTPTPTSPIPSASLPQHALTLAPSLSTPCATPAQTHPGFFSPLTPPAPSAALSTSSPAFAHTHTHPALVGAWTESLAAAPVRLLTVPSDLIDGRVATHSPNSNTSASSSNIHNKNRDGSPAAAAGADADDSNTGASPASRTTSRAHTNTNTSATDTAPLLSPSLSRALSLASSPSAVAPTALARAHSVSTAYSICREIPLPTTFPPEKVACLAELILAIDGQIPEVHAHAPIHVPVPPAHAQMRTSLPSVRAHAHTHSGNDDSSGRDGSHPYQSSPTSHTIAITASSSASSSSPSPTSTATSASTPTSVLRIPVLSHPVPIAIPPILAAAPALASSPSTHATLPSSPDPTYNTTATTSNFDGLVFGSPSQALPTFSPRAFHTPSANVGGVSGAYIIQDTSGQRWVFKPLAEDPMLASYSAQDRHQHEMAVAETLLRSTQTSVLGEWHRQTDAHADEDLGTSMGMSMHADLDANVGVDGVCEHEDNIAVHTAATTMSTSTTSITTATATAAVAAAAVSLESVVVNDHSHPDTHPATNSGSQAPITSNATSINITHAYTHARAPPPLSPALLATLPPPPSPSCPRPTLPTPPLLHTVSSSHSPTPLNTEYRLASSTLPHATILHSPHAVMQSPRTTLHSPHGITHPPPGLPHTQHGAMYYSRGITHSVHSTDATHPHYTASLVDATQHPPCTIAGDPVHGNAAWNNTEGMLPTANAGSHALSPRAHTHQDQQPHSPPSATPRPHSGAHTPSTIPTSAHSQAASSPPTTLPSAYARAVDCAMVYAHMLGASSGPYTATQQSLASEQRCVGSNSLHNPADAVCSELSPISDAETIHRSCCQVGLLAASVTNTGDHGAGAGMSVENGAISPACYSEVAVHVEVDDADDVDADSNANDTISTSAPLSLPALAPCPSTASTAAPSIAPVVVPLRFTPTLIGAANHTDSVDDSTRAPAHANSIIAMTTILPIASLPPASLSRNHSIASTVELLPSASDAPKPLHSDIDAVKILRSDKTARDALASDPDLLNVSFPNSHTTHISPHAAASSPYNTATTNSYYTASNQHYPASHRDTATPPSSLYFRNATNPSSSPSDPPIDAVYNATEAEDTAYRPLDTGYGTQQDTVYDDHFDPEVMQRHSSQCASEGHRPTDTLTVNRDSTGLLSRGTGVLGRGKGVGVGSTESDMGQSPPSNDHNCPSIASSSMPSGMGMDMGVGAGTSTGANAGTGWGLPTRSYTANPMFAAPHAHAHASSRAYGHAHAHAHHPSSRTHAHTHGRAAYVPLSQPAFARTRTHAHTYTRTFNLPPAPTPAPPSSLHIELYQSPVIVAAKAPSSAMLGHLAPPALSLGDAADVEGEGAGREDREGEVEVEKGNGCAEAAAGAKAIAVGTDEYTTGEAGECVRCAVSECVVPAGRSDEEGSGVDVGVGVGVSEAEVTDGGDDGQNKGMDVTIATGIATAITTHTSTATTDDTIKETSFSKPLVSFDFTPTTAPMSASGVTPVPPSVAAPEAVSVVAPVVAVLTDTTDAHVSPAGACANGFKDCVANLAMGGPKVRSVRLSNHSAGFSHTGTGFHNPAMGIIATDAVSPAPSDISLRATSLATTTDTMFSHPSPLSPSPPGMSLSDDSSQCSHSPADTSSTHVQTLGYAKTCTSSKMGTLQPADIGSTVSVAITVSSTAPISATATATACVPAAAPASVPASAPASTPRSSLMAQQPRPSLLSSQLSAQSSAHLSSSQLAMQTHVRTLREREREREKDGFLHHNPSPIDRDRGKDKDTSPFFSAHTLPLNSLNITSTSTTTSTSSSSFMPSSTTTRTGSPQLSPRLHRAGVDSSRGKGTGTGMSTGADGYTANEASSPPCPCPASPLPLPLPSSTHSSPSASPYTHALSLLPLPAPAPSSPPMLPQALQALHPPSPCLASIPTSTSSNPASTSLLSPLKHGISAGHTPVREVAAYMLDHGHFARVPPTLGVVLLVPHIGNASFPPGVDAIATTHVDVDALSPKHAKQLPLLQSSAQDAAMSSELTPLRCDSVPPASDSTTVSLVTASLQRFATNDGCIEDFGPTEVDGEHLHHVAQLDLRLLNLDRHSGNILVGKSKNNGKNGDFPGESRKRSLVPIDHSYILPSINDLSDLTFDWLSNPQIKLPLSDLSKRYIAQLDPFHDAAVLRKLDFPVDSVLANVVATIILQRAVARGLTLYDVGHMFIRGAQRRSVVEGIVEECIGYGATVTERVMAEPANQGLLAFEVLQVWLGAFLHEVCVCADVEIDRCYASNRR